MTQQQKLVRCENSLVHINELIKEDTIPHTVAVFATSDGPLAISVDNGPVQGLIMPDFDTKERAAAFSLLNSDFQKFNIIAVETERLVSEMLQEVLFLFNPLPGNWNEYDECFFILGNESE